MSPDDFESSQWHFFSLDWGLLWLASPFIQIPLKVSCVIKDASVTFDCPFIDLCL
jgi:hypothetical protein